MRYRGRKEVWCDHTKTRHAGKHRLAEQCLRCLPLGRKRELCYSCMSEHQAEEHSPPASPEDAQRHIDRMRRMVS